METAPLVLEYPVDDDDLCGPSLEVVDYVGSASVPAVWERLAS